MFTETSYYQTKRYKYNMTATDKTIYTDRFMLKKSLVMTDVSRKVSVDCLVCENSEKKGRNVVTTGQSDAFTMFV